MRETLMQLLKSAEHRGLFTAAVVGVVDATGNDSIIPYGSYPAHGIRCEVTEQSIFDVASLTKTIPVSLCALRLVDQGKLTLDMPVISFLPELHTNYREVITLKNLLTWSLDYHESLAAHKDKTAEELYKRILSTRFRYPPGGNFTYANATSILLGRFLENYSGKRLDELAAELLFIPLSMTRTTFHPEIFPHDEFVPTEHDVWRGRILQGEVHDESASVLRELFIPGSAGLFSTVPDLLQICHLLLQEGLAKGVRIFSTAMIQQMATNQFTSEKNSVGLGWELNQKQYMGSCSSLMTIGKTGFTGCVIVIDLLKKRGYVLLTNYHFPQRKSNVHPLTVLRRSVSEIVFC